MGAGLFVEFDQELFFAFLFLSFLVWVVAVLLLGPPRAVWLSGCEDPRSAFLALSRVVVLWLVGGCGELPETMLVGAFPVGAGGCTSGTIAASSTTSGVEGSRRLHTLLLPAAAEAFVLLALDVSLTQRAE